MWVYLASCQINAKLDQLPSKIQSLSWMKGIQHGANWIRTQTQVLLVLISFAEFDGQTCDVMPYSDTSEAVRDVPVVTAATAWTCLHQDRQDDHTLFPTGTMVWEEDEDELDKPKSVNHLASSSTRTQTYLSRWNKVP
jgi:hypothetical protein